MKERARKGLVSVGAIVWLATAPALAQMEVQIGPGPVDPNATPGSPLNPRNSLLHPQPVRPAPVNPSMRILPTPYPDALRPQTQFPRAGFTTTLTKKFGRKKSNSRKSGTRQNRPEKMGWLAQVPSSAPSAIAIDKPGEVSSRLVACWKPPALPVHQEVTVRVGFNRDGRAIGEPRITYTGGALNDSHRETLRRSIISAISDCTPLRFTPGLASAIAGRPFAIRFIAPAQKPSGKTI